MPTTDTQALDDEDRPAVVDAAESTDTETVSTQAAKSKKAVK